MRKELKDQIDRAIKKYGGDILVSPNFRASNNNIQHSDVSVMKHSLKVARTSMWLNKKLHANAQERDLVRGALLHDYFLYDWHDDDHRGIQNLHGFYHPGVALKNAMKEYSLSKKEKNIIYTHMWPLTLTHMPTCREAWLVTAADKYISTIESLRLHKLRRFIPVRVREKDR